MAKKKNPRTKTPKIDPELTEDLTPPVVQPEAKTVEEPKKTAAKRKLAAKKQWPKPVWRKIIIAGLGLLVAFLGAAYYYGIAGNFEAPKGAVKIDIPTGSSYAEVEKMLIDKKILKNRHTFSVVASVVGYKNAVKPGRYKISTGYGNFRLLLMLRNGLQEPVKVSFLSTRTIDKLAEHIANQVEFTKEDFLNAVNDPNFRDELKKDEPDPRQYDDQNLMGIFIPNTYEMYYNISPQAFIRRMKKEYKQFWSENRLKQASDIGLSPREVVVLASIVEAETRKNDEKERIAGVYMNRLNGKLGDSRLLNADPTVVFAVGDFSIKRVLRVHTQYDSPYNTYKYEGLTPGPINCPSLPSIKAVLNYERHNYVYFCAKEDFSGYHAFAETKRDHNINADRYQTALEAYLRKKNNK